jgi:CspA family cold shock protein
MLRMAILEGDFTMAKGTVKWFNATKGFGFIAPESGGKDVFVHVTALERAGIRQLNDGQAVTFDVEAGRDGRESAINLALA